MLKINLRHKFILYFTPLILGIFLFGVYSVLTFASVHTQFARLQKDVTPNVLAMMELKRVLLALEEGIDKKNIDRAEISRQLKIVGNIVSDHADVEGEIVDPGQRAAHKMLHHAIRTMGLSRYILKQSVSGWQGKDLAEIADIIRKERLALGPLLDEHLAAHLQQLAATEAFVSQKYRITVILAGLGMAGILVLTFIILLVMMRSILGPIKALQEGARQFGEGNLDYKLAISTGDELEFLAGEFTNMAQKLSGYHARLDGLVQERTRELVQTNKDLEKEIAERQKVEEEQRQSEEQIHFLSQELLQVQESERQQIALDLHDNVAQELSALKVAAESVFGDSTVELVSLADERGRFARLLNRCVKTVRDLSYNLRPPGLEQMGLLSAVRDYCRSWSKDTGCLVNFSSAGMGNISPVYNDAINVYRLLQEALTNINKHAGASRVDVKLVSSHPDIILRIEDNGCGFDLRDGYRKAQHDKRLGLLGMEERVSMLGGRIKIRSIIGEGTKILIEIPMEKS